MSKILAKDNQSILDFALQNFGTLEQLYTLLADNSLSANSKLSAGQELTVNNVNVGDEDIKNFVTLKNVSFNNDQGVNLPPILGGDYGNDFGNDYN